MDVSTIIVSALSAYAPDVAAEHYDGTAESYITWNYSDERPVVYADNTDILDETTVQVHRFTKSNPEADKKAIRKALRSADFSILSTSQFYESDTGYFHVVVTAKIGGSVDD